MKLKDLEFLKCVDCQSDLEIGKHEIKNDTILHAILKCKSCSRKFPVIDEVGVFFKRESFKAHISDYERFKLKELGYDEILEELNAEPLDYEKSQLQVAKNWEYQHEKVYNWEQDKDSDAFHGKRLFWTFIPINPEDIKDKTVYVVCTGRGKEVCHVLDASPKKIFANDIGTAIYSARKIIGVHNPKIVWLRFDVSFSPLKPEVADIAICDHALQHIFDHRLAFKMIVETLKNPGTVGICVYSYENNFLLTHIIEPLKVLLTSLPLWLIRLLSFFPAILIFAAIHLFYLPLNKLEHKRKKLKLILPLYEHMIFWSTSPFSFVWSACFDLMHAPISYHFKQNELHTLAQENSLELITLNHTHGTTWSLVAKKKQTHF